MAETRRVIHFYERTAGAYDRSMNFFDKLLFEGGREWVCSRARGRVLEIAAGTGRNLRYYRQEIELSGLDVSPTMLATARRRAAEMGRRVNLMLADAQALPFQDQSFETVVCTLGLCTIPDDRRAIAEARRIVKPGGQILLLEHVRSAKLPVRWAEQALNPLAVRFQGDHLTRDPLDHLRGCGFSVEECERSKLGIVERIAARRK